MSHLNCHSERVIAPESMPTLRWGTLLVHVVSFFSLPGKGLRTHIHCERLTKVGEEARVITPPHH